MTSADTILWEMKNEKNKAGVRWLIVFIFAPYLSYLLATGRANEIGSERIFNGYYIGSLTAFIALVNLWTLWKLHQGKNGNWSIYTKYITMIADFLAVALSLIPTGGNESVFFTINYVVIVSNSLRYGMRMAIAGVFTMNLFYVGVLAYQFFPQLYIPGAQKEILKLSGFWLVGIYTGYLSRRFENLRGEVEKYQKLLAEALKQNG